MQSVTARRIAAALACGGAAVVSAHLLLAHRAAPPETAEPVAQGRGAAAQAAPDIGSANMLVPGVAFRDPRPVAADDEPARPSAPRGAYVDPDAAQVRDDPNVIAHVGAYEDPIRVNAPTDGGVVAHIGEWVDPESAWPQPASGGDRP